MPDPAPPTRQSPRVRGRKRVTYSWTRIIIVFFICLTLFTSILAVLIKFVIRVPTEQKPTLPTTRSSTIDALSTPTLPTTATAPIATTITIIPTIATTSTAHVASSTATTNVPRTTTTTNVPRTTTTTNVPRTTTKQTGMVNKMLPALVEYFFHIKWEWGWIERHYL